MCATRPRRVWPSFAPSVASGPRSSSRTTGRSRTRTTSRRPSSYLAGLAKYDAESGLERHRPYSVAHFNLPRWVPPTFIVDIGEWAEAKEAAILCHRSQLHNPTSDEPETALTGAEFLEQVRARSRHYGALIVAAHGEPFLVREALNVADPIRLLGRPMNLFY